MEQIKFKSFDGEELACYLFTAVKQPKGVVQIIHGMSEHALRYTKLAEILNDNGYIVFADDHRAHGQTAKKPENVGKYNRSTNLYTDTVYDEIEISKMLKKKYPALPLFIFGHSYGSLLTQRYIQECNLHDGAIICGSSYMKTLLNKLAKIIAKITMRHKGADAPAKLIEKLSFKQYSKGLGPDELWISHNKEVCDAYKNDPFCGNQFSAKFYYDLMSGVLEAYKKCNLDKIDLEKPLLLIAGEQDKFSNNAKLVVKLYKQYINLGVKDISLITYPGMRHEVHNENNNEQVYIDIIDFFNKISEQKHK